MSGLEKDEQTITVTVSPRVYTREEADAVFYEVMEGMEERIRGKNESLQAVSQDLKLPSYLSEYGVRVRWHSSEPEYLPPERWIRKSKEHRRWCCRQSFLQENTGQILNFR